MSPTLAPRVVVASRRSELDELLVRHGTRSAADFFLRQRGRDLDQVAARHSALQQALTVVDAAVPADWRRGRVERADLSRFLFAPEDIVIAVGQDGLVANVAKYLSGQPVIGVDPDPGRNPGVLVRFPADVVAGLLPSVVAGAATIESRTMVAASLDDGQELVGLNEIFVGHDSHQSARYLLSTADGASERQSSSGVVAGTGTGATGWCASIVAERSWSGALPVPCEPRLWWFAREAWPSPATGVSLTGGGLGPGEELRLACESERLVVFADGLEADRLVLGWGQQVSIGVSRRQLRLVVPPT